MPSARFAAAQCSLGLVAPDTVVTNATVFNVFTAAFEPDREVWVKEGLVAYCGAARDRASRTWTSAGTQVIDAGGMVVLPGLIDGHTHLPDAVSIEEFVRYVVPTGTTTLVLELMEVAMVGGEAALRAFAAGLACQPIRLFYTVPALAAPVDPGDRPAHPVARAGVLPRRSLLPGRGRGVLGQPTPRRRAGPATAGSGPGRSRSGQDGGGTQRGRVG